MMILPLVGGAIFYADSAYFRYEDKLYFKNQFKKCVLISKSKEIIEQFDKITSPDDTQKILTQTQLDAITQLTGHQRPLTESSFSRNKGMMKANSPNFVDELSDYSMRNRVPDIGQAPSHIRSENFSPFVGSISGHLFYFIAMMLEYAENHQADKNLESDINNFINTYIFTYINRGYHSLSEMVLPLHDLQETLKAYGVKIDMDFSSESGHIHWKSHLPDELIQQACQDTQEYAKHLYLGKLLNQEIERFDHHKLKKISPKMYSATELDENTVFENALVHIINDQKNGYRNVLGKEELNSYYSVISIVPVEEKSIYSEEDEFKIILKHSYDVDNYPDREVKITLEYLCEFAEQQKSSDSLGLSRRP